MGNTRKIYLKIKGNCGNQFFQYAFARNIQERYGGELIIDYSWARNSSTAWPGADNLLSDFNTVDYTYLDHTNRKATRLLTLVHLGCFLGRCRDFTTRLYKYYLWCARHLEKYGLYYFDSPYYPYQYNARGDVVIDGYFECSKYFADIDDKICRELTPKHPLLEQNKELYRVITDRPSVCISIKRQDVENPDISDVYDYSIDYFYHAVSYIQAREPEAVFVIFSDNVGWCKENFKLDAETYYEAEGNPIWEKIRLMSGCKHFIIHNSTFSWWVQHLSVRDGKIVIAPVKWMLRDDAPIDIYEDNWIYMRNDGTIQEEHD